MILVKSQLTEKQVEPFLITF